MKNKAWLGLILFALLTAGVFTNTTSLFHPSLGDCDNATTSKVLYDLTTGRFSCGTDQTGVGGGTDVSVRLLSSVDQGVAAGPFGLTLSWDTEVFDAGGMHVNDAAEVTDITTVADESGSLDGTCFLIYDASGSVGVWLDVDDGGGAAPAACAAAGRQIEFNTLATDDSANAVATALATLLNGDGAWSCPAPGANVVTCTDAAVGTRTDAADSVPATGFTFNVTTQGQTLGSRITIPADQGGKYLIGCSAGWIADSVGVRVIRLIVDGVVPGGLVAQHDYDAGADVNNVNAVSSVTTLLSLAAGQYVECNAANSSTTDPLDVLGAGSGQVTTFWAVRQPG